MYLKLTEIFRSHLEAARAQHAQAQLNERSSMASVEGRIALAKKTAEMKGRSDAIRMMLDVVYREQLKE